MGPNDRFKECFVKIQGDVEATKDSNKEEP